MAPGPEVGATVEWSENSATPPVPSGPVVNCNGSLGGGPEPKRAPATVDPYSTPGSAPKRGTMVSPATVPSLGLRTRNLTAKPSPGATVGADGVIESSRPGQVTPAGGTATAASMWPMRTS